MNPELISVGVGGTVAYIILREVFTFLNRRRNGFNGKCMKVLIAQVRELHEWHDRRDAEGVPVWYVRKSLEDAVGKLADNIGTQTQVLQNIVHAQEKGSNDIRRDISDLAGLVKIKAKP